MEKCEKCGADMQRWTYNAMSRVFTSICSMCASTRIENYQTQLENQLEKGEKS